MTRHSKLFWSFLVACAVFYTLRAEAKKSVIFQSSEQKHMVKKNYESAKQKCSEDGSKLAMFNSKKLMEIAKQELVKSITVKSKSPYFIDLQFQNGKLMWRDGSPFLKDKDFKYNQKVNAGSSCAVVEKDEFLTFTFYSYPCEKEASFICQQTTGEETPDETDRGEETESKRTTLPLNQQLSNLINLTESERKVRAIAITIGVIVLICTLLIALCLYHRIRKIKKKQEVKQQKLEIYYSKQEISSKKSSDVVHYKQGIIAPRK